MARGFPECSSSSSQQNHPIYNLLVAQTDVVHPPGVPPPSLPMQNSENLCQPYGYLTSSVPGWPNNASIVFDPNSMQPVRIAEQQHHSSNNGGFAPFGFLHSQQMIESYGQASYLYSGGAVPPYPVLPQARPPKGRRNEAPPVLAWCEFCRVDCVTSEKLEQHRSGKKHKKQVQMFSPSPNHNSALTGSADKVIPQLKAGAGEAPEGLNEVQEGPDSSKMRGKKKRKKSGVDSGLGGGPWECKMCDITCNSQVVFDTHLAGRKHLTNLVRLHGRQYGEAMEGMHRAEQDARNSNHSRTKKPKRRRPVNPRGWANSAHQPPPAALSGAETVEMGKEGSPTGAERGDTTNGAEKAPKPAENVGGDYCSEGECHDVLLTIDEKTSDSVASEEPSRSEVLAEEGSLDAVVTI